MTEEVNLKILMIAHEKDLNGSSRSMINIIDHLKTEHEFSVVLPFDTGEVYAELCRRSVKVYCIKYNRWISFFKRKWYVEFLYWNIWGRWENKFSVRKVYKEIRNMNFNIIHSNTSVIDFGGALSKRLKIPHIWHIREMGKEDYNLRPFAGWSSAYKYIDKNATKIICVSEIVYKKIAKYVDSQKCIKIYNGVGKENIDSSHFYNLNSKDMFKVLVSGLICKAKRQDIAINAVAELNKRGIDNVELLIAGRGNLESLGIRYESFESCVKILGQVNDLHLLRKEVDVEVVCSSCEAFGRVTVEAMLSGLPVIASNSGASPEIVKDGFNGFLFSPNNYLELSDKLEYLILNRCKLQEMGENAFSYAKDHFVFDICAQKINALYYTFK